MAASTNFFFNFELLLLFVSLLKIFLRTEAPIDDDALDADNGDDDDGDDDNDVDDNGDDVAVDVAVFLNVGVAAVPAAVGDVAGFGLFCCFFFGRYL